MLICALLSAPDLAVLVSSCISWITPESSVGNGSVLGGRISHLTRGRTDQSCLSGHPDGSNLGVQMIRIADPVRISLKYLADDEYLAVLGG